MLFNYIFLVWSLIFLHVYVMMYDDAAAYAHDHAILSVIESLSLILRDMNYDCVCFLDERVLKKILHSLVIE